MDSRTYRGGGVTFIVLALLCFGALDTTTKVVSAGAPVVMALWLRYLVQAALTSAATFAGGAAIPLAIAIMAPAGSISWAVSGGSLVCLALLGALGARIGGADLARPTIRVTFWGAFAMAATWGIGALVGHAV